jgi:hypothetical protein
VIRGGASVRGAKVLVVMARAGGLAGPGLERVRRLKVAGRGVIERKEDGLVAGINNANDANHHRHYRKSI